jgi:hypothetical protein
MDAYMNCTSAGPSMHGKSMFALKGGRSLAKAEQLSFKTTGVIVHGYEYFLYVLHHSIAANSNSKIHCLHMTVMHMLDALDDPTKERVQLWPKFICIQVDGASDNKSRRMFAYLEWLILNETFETICISFLLVGHTHADYDQKFIPIT